MPPSKWENWVGPCVLVALGCFLVWVGLRAIRGHFEKPSNACPIDGALAQSSKRINGNSCEYFHFNAVERQMHSWVADCVK
jgi:hypothetical protein